MSDDKNKAQGDAGGDDVARHLAEKRKELNLQTRPLEVIADLDWDVDDDELPTEEPAAAAPAAPAAAAPVDTAAHDAQVAARGGTMLMSADAFREALDTAGKQAAEAAAAPQPSAAANDAMTARGGTMLLSGADMQEALADPHFRERGVFAHVLTGEDGRAMPALPSSVMWNLTMASGKSKPATPTETASKSMSMEQLAKSSASNSTARGAGSSGPAPRLH